MYMQLSMCVYCVFIGKVGVNLVYVLLLGRTILYCIILMKNLLVVRSSNCQLICQSNFFPIFLLYSNIRSAVHFVLQDVMKCVELLSDDSLYIVRSNYVLLESALNQGLLPSSVLSALIQTLSLARYSYFVGCVYCMCMHHGICSQASKLHHPALEKVDY